MAGRPEGTTRGNGGETHQGAGPGIDRLTTNHGVTIADNQNQLKAHARGPVLLEDMIFREKMMHFDHERIPERIVHARGTGAHGYFELTDSLADFTTARILTEVGERTEVFVRFSTVAGSKGSTDTPRDVRGFATKFYTKDGNWDLVGNNVPVFFIQDAMKFPDLVHSVKPEADRGFPQATAAHDTFWDFTSLMPESVHMLMWAMSDRTIPRSFRTMEGFGVHSFRLIDAEGRSTFVKYHWKPKLGLQSTVWDETVKIAGADPDYQRRDLFEAIDRGDFPEWELGVQLFDQEAADKLPFDHLDATKIIPEELIPVRIVGRMVLDRYPNNFFAETEQVAFCPSHLVPGMDFSNDPLLQGRLFSYLDTQLKRLGSTNFHQLPTNRAKGREGGCPFSNFQRDGHMQMNVPKGRANYEPNSLALAGEGGGPREDPQTGFTSFREPMEEGPKSRIRAESFADHYSQARLFWRSMHPAEQSHIVSAFTFELSKCQFEHVQQRTIANLRNVDEDLAARVAKSMNVDLPQISPAAQPVQDLPPSPALRIVGNMKETLEGRCVGILIHDGSDADEIAAVRQAVNEAGGRCFVVALKIGGAKLSDGNVCKADGQLAGSPSVLFDAVAIILSDDGARELVGHGSAVQFVMDAFGHLKAIGYSKDAQPLLDKAGVQSDEGVTGLNTGFISAAKQRFFDREAQVRATP
ncbi:catalase [Sphingomonas turrisvirgatae]|uniref:Catalase n=1 Tax=Sphingomonas turrisvirgatae TaxID=1888892 RepID=A0A1E3LW41_9SPHN|nr:catalase [Sphingomonas turrisvirgatae]ODP37956.1 catalase HPII [Sphingomonas turrisvirgatae]